MDVQGVELAAKPAESNLLTSYMGVLDVSPRTRKNYERAFKQFLNWADATGKNPAQLRRTDLAAYRDSLLENHKASTVRAYLVPVRAFYKWTASEGLYPNIAEGLKAPKQPRGFAKDCLTPDQIGRVFSVLEGRSDANAIRDTALVTVIAMTGLRTIEAARADIGDLRTMGGKRVLWVQGKGRDSKDDFVVIPADAGAALDAYLASRGEQDPEAPLFASKGNRNKQGRMTTRSISRICKESFRAAGIDSERITAHSLRHTAVTAALMGGATVQEAQAMARHSNINTTMIYSHNIDRAANPAEEKAAAYFKRERR